ncbi:MAG: RNA methyltransferase [Myxococcota bacterium]
MSLEHITIVLVRPQQPGNIGVAARAIANHGIGRMALVQPQGFDPDRARWMAPKSHHIINNAHFCDSISEAVASSQRILATTARPRTQDWTVWSPEEAASVISEDPVPTAILFGPEDNGLSSEDMALVQSIVTFPTTEVSSLNLGQAVTALCAELRRSGLNQDPVTIKSSPDAVNAGVQEALIHHAITVLDKAGYLQGRSQLMVENTLFRLTSRTQLTSEEVHILQGMVKQIDWRFKAGLK